MLHHAGRWLHWLHWIQMKKVTKFTDSKKQIHMDIGTNSIFPNLKSLNDWIYDPRVVLFIIWLEYQLTILIRNLPRVRRYNHGAPTYTIVSKLKSFTTGNSKLILSKIPKCPNVWDFKCYSELRQISRFLFLILLKLKRLFVF